MLFDLEVRVGEEVVPWTFGTTTCQVTDHEGLRLNPKPLGWEARNVPSPQEKKVRDLDVFLGFNCNLKCKYCFQREHKDSWVGVPASPDKVPGFIELLKTHNFPRPKEVSFWGGEPTVFWKTIEVLVPALEALWPGITFGMVTNGVLIDKKKVDFMKEHHFNIGVSCDGLPDARGFDLLSWKTTEMKYMMEQLPKDYIFQCCIGKGNDDAHVAIARFRKYLGPDVKVSVAHPIRANSADDAVAPMCEYDFEKTSDSMFEEHLAHPENYPLGSRVKWAKRFLTQRAEAPLDGKYCGADSGRAVSMDIAGNTYTCHFGEMAPTGHISNWRERDMSAFHSPAEREGCDKCPMFPFCRAGCPMTSNSGAAVSCRGAYALYWAVFRAAFKDLWDVEVLSIKPHKE